MSSLAVAQSRGVELVATAIAEGFGYLAMTRYAPNGDYDDTFSNHGKLYSRAIDNLANISITRAPNGDILLSDQIEQVPSKRNNNINGSQRG